MTLIELLNEYKQASVGNLSLAEQAVYFRLVLIWNGLRRPEWFSVSDGQLMREAGAGSHHTISKARRKLEEAGFIVTKRKGNGHALMFHMCDPTTAENAYPTTAENAEGKNEPRQKMPTYHGKNCRGGRQNLPTSQSTEYLQSDNTYTGENLSPKKIKSSSRSVKIQSSNLNSIGVQEAENRPTTTPSGIPQKVLDFYQQEIRPVCSPFELEKLTDDVEHYGGDVVVKAIERAVIRNKRNLGYVESILKHWELDGYDNGKGDRYKHDNMAGHSNQGESADEWADRLAREYNFDG